MVSHHYTTLHNTAHHCIPLHNTPLAHPLLRPFYTTDQQGTKAILLHYDTMNNPNPAHHGLDMQLWSFDDGRTWDHSGTVLAYVTYFIGTH